MTEFRRMLAQGWTLISPTTRDGCNYVFNVLSSSAGICAICGEYAEKRYGGEGRYLPACIDCWLAADTGRDAKGGGRGD